MNESWKWQKDLALSSLEVVAVFLGGQQGQAVLQGTEKPRSPFPGVCRIT